jgi:hypothetical protein
MRSKCYGIKVVKHPRGFNYVVAFNSNKKLLSESTMLYMWDDKTKVVVYTTD